MSRLVYKCIRTAFPQLAREILHAFLMQLALTCYTTSYKHFGSLATCHIQCYSTEFNYYATIKLSIDCQTSSQLNCAEQAIILDLPLLLVAEHGMLISDTAAFVCFPSPMKPWIHSFMLQLCCLVKSYILYSFDPAQ